MVDENDQRGSRGQIVLGFLALIVSVPSVIGDWILRVHWLVWAIEQGIQLPGLTEMWISPIWHLISAVVLVGSAVLTMYRGCLVVGLGCWAFSYAIVVAWTALAVYLPWVKITTHLGAQA